MVYMDTTGTLPGQLNSETYVEVPPAALLNRHLVARPIRGRQDIRPA
jgi:hypothetical protein